jgi:hypothetical protein
LMYAIVPAATVYVVVPSTNSTLVQPGP